MSRRTLITIVVLAVLAGLSFTVTQRKTAPDDGPSEPLPEGYYLTDARLQSTDDAGVLRYELRARRIDQATLSQVILGQHHRFFDGGQPLLFLQNALQHRLVL